MVKAYKPANLSEALEIRSQKNTIVFAGGSDIMVRHRSWSGTVADFPETVLFIGHLEELGGISTDKDKIIIGSVATFAQLLQDNRLPEYIKLPLARIGSAAIRNLGTMGGNICNASPAGDTLPMLYALDAEVTVATLDKTFTVGIADFITGPGRNILKPDELVTQITIPLGDYNRFYYQKVGQRKVNTISKASFFAVAKIDDTQVHEVKITVGAVSPTVVRDPETEALIKSVRKRELPDIIDVVKGRYEKLINPIDDLRSTKKYRRRVSLNLLEDFLRGL